MSNKTSFECPVCSEMMESYNGDGNNPSNGYMVVCNNKDCHDGDIRPHENVYGHGTTEKNAYEIAKQKFGGK